ncbi:putative MFS family arabinose efflux permease [Lipingzhangella halophila]|uniref:Putative MFS family arabinose efflux permease n=1 Tax=Lipingzhangella halophila TaxID=1783352 RepID=A0A7W7W5Z2_9ACTN|nr:MFS transporter [Lipingzhangella halophila]MBB4934335.1 putative MFS family arabinose efflux permease [Lipingzhangella halophila]
MDKPRTGSRRFTVPTQVRRGLAPLPEGQPSAEQAGTTPSRPPPPVRDWRTSYGEIIRVREFQSLWLAHALSMTGSYLLNIAVTALVYQQTSSALTAGVTLALTFLPQVVGGPLLSGLADLYPRRRVIIASDVMRAALIASIGIPGLPLGVLWALLFLSILPMVPYTAARAALLAEIVQGERYVAGSAIINMTSQVGTLVGLAVGGWVISAIGPHATLTYDGLTFLVAGAVIRLGVRARSAPPYEDTAKPTLWRVTRDGTRLVFGDPRLRTLGLFAWLAGFYMVPYGLANPLADEMGGGPGTAGLIMAGPSVGAVLGGLVLTRFISPNARMRLIGPLAVAASAPLLLWMLHPPLWLMVALLAISGMAASYQFVANAAFVLCVPAESRGLAFGLVAAGLQAAQGIGIAAGSLLAESSGTHAVVSGAGVLGIAGAVLLAVPWTRISPGAVALMQQAEPPKGARDHERDNS